MPEPQRTCVGCRTRRPQANLLRVRRLAGGDIVPAVRRAELATSQGRSAYLCPSQACLTRAVKRGGFTRAFARQGSVAIDTDRLWSTLRDSLRNEYELLQRTCGRADALPRVHRLRTLEVEMASGRGR
ncbi:MAG: YlxR family protein [Myxococcales bacterium]|nr:YlxR family protein [Myxococcales bacterium]